MSFLGDLVGSIGSGQAPPPPPPKPQQRPPVPLVAAQTKFVPKPVLNAAIISPPPSLKRKLDERDANDSGKVVRPIPSPALPNNVRSRPATPVSGNAKPVTGKPVTNNPPGSAAPPAKPPAKGSYAEIMAKAKEAQERKTQSRVGMIKHQATTKEKPSKLAERRREEQEKLKAAKQKGSQKDILKEKSKGKSVENSVRIDQPKQPKTPRPPLHAPASSTYKGTMGTSSNRKMAPAGRGVKQSKYDEYLGTDEEEDSEMEDYGEEGEGYGSDGSSDMEGGFDDIEGEEALALRAAREDDARELALEKKLKTEKETRRLRLQAMARKGR